MATAQRVAAIVEVLGPPAQQEEQRAFGEAPGEEEQGLPGRIVRPLDVLDHDEPRNGSGDQCGERRREGVEQPRPGGRLVGKPRTGSAPAGPRESAAGIGTSRSISRSAAGSIPASANATPGRALPDRRARRSAVSDRSLGRKGSRREDRPPLPSRSRRAFRRAATSRSRPPRSARRRDRGSPTRRGQRPGPPAPGLARRAAAAGSAPAMARDRSDRSGRGRRAGGRPGSPAVDRRSGLRLRHREAGRPGSPRTGPWSPLSGATPQLAFEDRDARPILADRARSIARAREQRHHLAPRLLVERIEVQASRGGRDRSGQVPARRRRGRQPFEDVRDRPLNRDCPGRSPVVELRAVAEREPREERALGEGGRCAQVGRRIRGRRGLEHGEIDLGGRRDRERPSSGPPGSSVHPEPTAARTGSGVARHAPIRRPIRATASRPARLARRVAAPPRAAPGSRWPCACRRLPARPRSGLRPGRGGGSEGSRQASWTRASRNGTAPVRDPVTFSGRRHLNVRCHDHVPQPVGPRPSHRGSFRRARGQRGPMRDMTTARAGIRMAGWPAVVVRLREGER